MTLSLALLLAISSCATTEPIPIVKTEVLDKNFVIQPRPKGVTMRSMQFYTVTPSNMAQFVRRFKDDNDGELVYIAISIPDYENLAVNISELKRYIQQQQSLIKYYEELLIKDSYK